MAAKTVSVAVSPAQTKVAKARSRYVWMLIFFAATVCVLLGRALYLHVMHRDFLQSQGDARLLREVPIAAHRGRFLDRGGEPLAVSTPLDSLWVNPADFIQGRERWPELAALLDMRPADFAALLKPRMAREFIYLQRHVSPALAKQALDLNIPGLLSRREYRRYYPNAEITAHVLGFTDIDDHGQEALELAFDSVLAGEAGRKQIIQDRLGRVIADVRQIRKVRPGQDIRLSIDRRISYVAYRELAAAVAHHQAKAGSLIVMLPDSGEILAMVNQPGYNPNNRSELHSTRNRAVTDIFEPGSTMKPFTIAAALASGDYQTDSIINTSPGYFSVGGNAINDPRSYGWIDLGTIITKSSNVGAAKLALTLEPKHMWSVLDKAGFGRPGGSGFPGEASGHLAFYREWLPFRQASMAFGYGLSVSLLQLAHGYSIFANQGELRPLRFTAEAHVMPPVERVISPQTATSVLKMLETVVTDGTGDLAQIPRYRVAGKTGTVHKAVQGGYAEDRYRALFVGLVPAYQPRLLIAVVIDEPRVNGYYGGEVAAPVFAKVAEESLRLLNIPP
jgi:cell division protein FtsI (penicillin-binding protein 3)